MTINEFEQAKQVIENLQTINHNIAILEKAVDDAYRYSSNKPLHKLVVDRLVTTEELSVDTKFIAEALKYYTKEASRLEEEFDSIGKEHTK
jgi:hypothetical protein